MRVGAHGEQLLLGIGELIGISEVDVAVSRTRVSDIATISVFFCFFLIRQFMRWFKLSFKVPSVLVLLHISSSSFVATMFRIHSIRVYGAVHIHTSGRGHGQ